MGLHLNKPKMNAKHKLKEVTIPDGKIGAPDKSLALAQAAPHDVAEVTMTVLNDSLLAISWLPKMRYMPMWSDRHRTAVGKVVEVDGTRLRVVFGTGSRNPPLSWRTTFVNRLWPLRIPAMPPGAAIDIKSNTLQGWVDLATGEVDFEFDSEFGNMMGGADKTSGAPLQVSSRMTSEALEGNIFRSVGQRVQQDGSAKLVCISLVPATSDKGQTWFLQLPTDALSILRVKFGFVLKGDAMPVNN